MSIGLPSVQATTYRKNFPLVNIKACSALLCIAFNSRTFSYSRRRLSQTNEKLMAQIAITPTQILQKTCELAGLFIS